MKKFEAVLIFSPELQKTDLTKLNDFFKDQISKFKGNLINEEDWGLRDLTYQIKNNKKAFYNFYQIEIEGSKIQEIKDSLNKNENILRYLFITVDNHEELPTKLSLEKSN